MYVHVFDGSDSSMRALHGKGIPPSTFRPYQGRVEDLPDQRLCCWHYSQCVIRNVRGFSAHLEANARDHIAPIVEEIAMEP